MRQTRLFSAAAGFAVCLLPIGALAQLSGGAADSATSAARAQDALPNAQVRVLKPEIRKIEGIRTAIAGDVLSLDGLARGLKSDGLEIRVVTGGLEVQLPGDVLFDFDRASLRQGAFSILGKISLAARRAGGGRAMRIEGHTDAIGTPAYNLQLSTARAKAVADWLTRNGVGSTRLTVRGFGATRPIAPNRTATGQDDPAGRQRNRRVTVTFES